MVQRLTRKKRAHKTKAAVGSIAGGDSKTHLAQQRRVQRLDLVRLGDQRRDDRAADGARDLSAGALGRKAERRERLQHVERERADLVVHAAERRQRGADDAEARGDRAGVGERGGAGGGGGAELAGDDAAGRGGGGDGGCWVGEVDG